MQETLIWVMIISLIIVGLAEPFGYMRLHKIFSVVLVLAYAIFVIPGIVEAFIM